MKTKSVLLFSAFVYMGMGQMATTTIQV